MESPIIENNALMLSDGGLWIQAGNQTFDYSDGQATEIYLKTVVSRATDISSMSEELEKSIIDWVSAYHLSAHRANILNGLSLRPDHKILELGCGCGAITRYLAETGAMVDAIEGSPNRAEIARLRNRDLKNVNVINANFNALTLPVRAYDAIILVGVLEYAQKYFNGQSDSENVVTTILDTLKRSCKEDGFLFIAIENRIGLKYWLGATEDHFATPYHGIYGYPGGGGIQTFDRAQWERIIGKSQFRHHGYTYPFPDYKLAQVLISEDFLRQDPHAYSILYRIRSMDYARPNWTPDCDEFLTWRSLHGSGYLEQFANSFCILLSDSNDRIEKNTHFDFIHFSNRQREVAFRVVTQKLKGDSFVRKTSSSILQQKTRGNFEHRIDEATPYFSGPLLSTLWIDAILSPEDSTVFEGLLRQYLSFLERMYSNNEHRGYIFDYLPFNIIQDESGNYCIIEKEWWFEEDLEPNFVLFRSLYLFALENKWKMGVFCSRHRIQTIKDFIVHWFDVFDLSSSEIPRLSEIEQRIIETISENIDANHMNKVLGDFIPSCPIESAGGMDIITRLYWTGEESASFREPDSVSVKTTLGFERQTVRFRIFDSVRCITRLRFDPFEQMGCFQIHRFTILKSNSKTTCSEEILWEINTPEQIAQFASLSGIYHLKTSLYSLFVATNSDPFFELSMPKQLILDDSDTCFVVKIDVSLTTSLDGYYQLDRLRDEIDYLTHSVKDKAAQITTLIQQVDDKERHIQTIERHINDKERHIQTLEQYLADKIQRVRLKDHELAVKDHEMEAKDYGLLVQKELVAAKDNHIANLGATIDQLRRSRSIRLTTFLHHILIDIPFGWLRKDPESEAVTTVEEDVVVETSEPIPPIDTPHFGIMDENYRSWLKNNHMNEDRIAAIQKAVSALPHQPLITILMPVYNVDQRWLEQAIASVIAQLYGHWELCIVDDRSITPHIRDTLEKYADREPRIKVKYLNRNHGIAMASNQAAAMATGEYIGLLDHDDELSRDALFECVKVINRHPDVSLIYSDEDKMDLEGNRIEPFFKPDFSFDQLMSQNYICHFSVIKKKIFDRISGFRDGLNGSQDHDLVLRVVQHDDHVVHIPKILYHWRKIPGSTAAVFDSKSYAWEAGRRAVEDALNRSQYKGKAFFGRFQGSYHAKRDLVDRPMVSIVIPFRDQPQFLRQCLDSVLEKTTYDHFEILLADNRSEFSETRKLVETFIERDVRIRKLEMDIPFNYAKINNLAVREAKGKHVVLMNNDIQIITPNWIEALLEHSQREEIGAVGAKLLYPDRRLQHVGVVVGIYGNAGHCHKFMPADDIGYYARPHITHNVSAVTAALFMVEKSKFDAVGGLDAEHLTVAYNDVDFCLKLMEKGYQNLYTPYCEAIHHESASRGYETTPEKMERLKGEMEFFEGKWRGFLQSGDPFYNPNLTIDSENYEINLCAQRSINES